MCFIDLKNQITKIIFHGRGGRGSVEIFYPFPWCIMMKMALKQNTPGTAGGPGGRDRTLAVAKNCAKMTFFSGGEKNYPKKIFFLHISSSYAKILGEKLFRTWEIPRSGSKAEDGERERERKLVITMAKLRMAHASRLGQKFIN